MRQDFLLPDLGEGLTEAEVVSWHVTPGDRVALNQTLAEVETAKAVVELPSPYAGVIAELHAQAGDTVPVGSALISFTLSAPPETEAGESEEKAEPNLVGYGAAPASGRPARRARRGLPVAPSSDAAVNEAAPHDAIAHVEVEPAVGERPRSTPPVRKYAKDLGVDIALVAARIGDRIVSRNDVDEYLALTSASPGRASATPESTPGRGETRIPIRGVRKATAQAMVQSAFTAPHVSTFLTVDVTATMRMLEDLRGDEAVAGVRIGPLAVAAKAVCLALGESPSLNAHWDESAGEIAQFHHVDLGIAAATERGLLVPSIRNAHGMTLTQLAEAIARLAETARAGKTAPEDLAGGTFSITNIGVFGIDAGTPILPPGQSGILAMGAIRRQPWEHRGKIALREVMTLSLSFDHRIVDGAEGSRFLNDVAGILREPGRAMLLR